MDTLHIFALSVFFLIAALGLVMVIQSFFDPYAAFGIFKMATGFDFTETKNKDLETGKAFKTLLSFQASALLGSNAMTLFLAWMAFHEMNRLAWLALWYWPVMFLWHFIIYKKGTSLWYVQIVWIILTATALLLTKSIAL